MKPIKDRIKKSKCKCKRCGRFFLGITNKTSFCSKKCLLDDYKYKKRTEKNVIRLSKKCLYCKNEFYTCRKRQIYCSKKCSVIVRNQRYKSGFYIKGDTAFADRFEILVRDNFTCQYCGRNPRKHGVILHVDHIKPLSKGGKDDKNNKITSCDKCNLGKTDRDYTQEIFQYLRGKNENI